jgi:hypothetical protein
MRLLERPGSMRTKQELGAVPPCRDTHGSHRERSRNQDRYGAQMSSPRGLNGDRYRAAE